MSAMVLRCFLSCPAYGPVDEDASITMISQAQATAERHGWHLEVAESCRIIRPAGDWQLDEQLRQRELTAALDHDLWWLGRGGYGCVALLPALLRESAATSCRLIGFSDATVLHCAWAATGRGESLYAPMPGIAHGPRARHCLDGALQGSVLRYNQDSDPTAQVIRPGTAAGPVFAACLSVFAGMVGIPAMPDVSGHILALEDIDERPYRVDRALWQLHLAGHLRRVSALVWGLMPHQSPPGYDGPEMAEVMIDWARRLEIPTLCGLPFGHHPDPLTLINNRPSQLVAATDGTWHLAQEGR